MPSLLNPGYLNHHWKGDRLARRPRGCEIDRDAVIADRSFMIAPAAATTHRGNDRCTDTNPREHPQTTHRCVAFATATHQQHSKCRQPNRGCAEDSATG